MQNTPKIKQLNKVVPAQLYLAALEFNQWIEPNEASPILEQIFYSYIESDDFCELPRHTRSEHLFLLRHLKNLVANCHVQITNENEQEVQDVHG